MAKEQIFKRYCDVAFFQSVPPELPSFPYPFHCEKSEGVLKKTNKQRQVKKIDFTRYDITEIAPTHSQKQAEISEGFAHVENVLSFSGDDPVYIYKSHQ